MSGLTHLDEYGSARMVDVAGKPETARSATATGRIAMNAAALAAIRDGTVPKGDVLAAARIVDVGGKVPARRVAVASGTIAMSDRALQAIREGSVKKGDVLATARIAGIMAAKQTASLIPLCHPLSLDSVRVDCAVEANAVRVTATASLTGKTGVEMEAMVACNIALLTIYDMAKALDKGMAIEQVRLLAKTGGKSGDWTAD